MAAIYDFTYVVCEPDLRASKIGRTSVNASVVERNMGEANYQSDAAAKLAVGFAESRARALECGNFRVLTPHAVFIQFRNKTHLVPAFESVLHAHFSAFNIKGEWFALPPCEIVAKVAESWQLMRLIEAVVFPGVHVWWRKSRRGDVSNGVPALKNSLDSWRVIRDFAHV